MTTTAPASYQADEVFARQMDELDPLRTFQEEFHIPPHDAGGGSQIYLAGNSLGLQPRAVRRIVEEELDDWARFAVEGHFRANRPWYRYHEMFRESGARLVGARPGEVVMMNTLTVNLHLMMVSFYRPHAERYRILIEEPCFPSDNYAARTHLQTRGIDPADALLIARPREGEHTLRIGDIEALLARQGRQIALVMLGGVNFFTGQVLDMQRITAAAKAQGCTVGWDLAHAAGNVPMQLHDWEADFAVWCSYKYLNAGPGAVAGCFVHEKHGMNADLPRYAGWWGNDPDTRFKMQLQPDFVPRQGADGWQVSNPPILSMAPLKASLDLFDRAGMQNLRAKSVRLSGYLRFLLEHLPADLRGRFDIITPSGPEAQGCQLSLLVHERARDVLNALAAAGAVCDFREPNVIRAAPTPLYNSFHEAWRFTRLLERCLMT
jgi:kynureninase